MQRYIEEAMEKYFLIIGYGNPLRGDDGIGWHLAQHLIAQYALPEHQHRYHHVHVMACHQLTPELADDVCQAQRVLFIDACYGEPTGAWRCQPVTPREWSITSFTHHLDPPALLGFITWLSQTCPESQILSVYSSSLGYNEELSPPVQAIVPTLIEYINGLVGG